MKNNPYGILAFLHWHHAWNNWHFDEAMVEKAVAQLKELGVGFIRMDVLWADVRSGEQQFDFSRYDKIVSQLADNDIGIVSLLHYNKHHSENGKEIWMKPPDSVDEFTRYVEATVKHYRGRIQHWEIWNEPNHPFYWDAPEDGLARYCQLLKASYAAVKSVDPSALVLNGGLARPVVEGVQNLYRQGVKNSFDLLSIHTFIDPLSKNPEQEFDELVIGIQKEMASHGDKDKKIWITEMGCPGVPDAKNREQWFQGEGMSEAQQAEWLKKQFDLLKKHPQIEKMFWAFYRDTDGMFNGSTDHLGLVRFDLTPKPAFRKLQEMIQQAKQ